MGVTRLRCDAHSLLNEINRRIFSEIDNFVIAVNLLLFLPVLVGNEEHPAFFERKVQKAVLIRIRERVR